MKTATPNGEDALLAVHYLARTIEINDAPSLARALNQHSEAEQSQLLQEITAIAATLLELKSLMQLQALQSH